ncbi:hydrogenase expression/formation protein [Rhodoferax sp. GW822-FHT02A01]|uniref:hydrogenase expression/formation protein n=1 Tax=Rhodoferax sp. GW822-FHT02A01 TaxID=3141537 RepID=UPI00315C8BEA
MKEFPVPVVGVGPGSQLEEDSLEYMSMPQGMDTFTAPSLPEPEEIAARVGAHHALRAALAELGAVCEGSGNRVIDLNHLSQEDRTLINQVLGEGEVSAIVKAAGPGMPEMNVQESVFAGVWRVIQSVDGVVVSDALELGAIPAMLVQAAKQDLWEHIPRWQGELPPNVHNAPSLLAELEDQWSHWHVGLPAHVINLTLLPMSDEDIGFLDHHLGTGRVLILSRGYGNCRILNTRTPHCWRVVYYNSQDTVILNTVEVTEIPEVALAAPEDLKDSCARLKEVLEWVEHA